LLTGAYARVVMNIYIAQKPVHQLLVHPKISRFGQGLFVVHIHVCLFVHINVATCVYIECALMSARIPVQARPQITWYAQCFFCHIHI